MKKTFYSKFTKKSLNVFALFVLISVNIFTPITYAEDPVVNDWKVTLIAGSDFNRKIKELAWWDLWNIKAIKKYDGSEIPAGLANTWNISSDSEKPVVTWFDDAENTIYYFTKNSVVMNADSSLMFKNCDNLTDIAVLSSWDASNVESLSDFFNNCSSLVDASAVYWWNTSKVENMKSLFYWWGFKELDLSRWNTSNVKFMNNMFHLNSSLENIKGLENRDTRKVENMRFMFARCPKLKELNLKSWNTSNVVDMSSMFFIAQSEVSSLEKILVSSDFMVENVTDSENMFKWNTALKWWYGSMCPGDCRDSNPASDKDKTYAKIDVPWQKWYFTSADPIVLFETNWANEENFAEIVKSWSTVLNPNISLTRDNSNFVGWYDDIKLTVEFDFSSIINSDTTIYAKWDCEDGYRLASDGQSCIIKEKDWTIVQDLDLYFVDENSKVVHYTIMDRNMWAKEACTWTDNSYTYGYYYQWWNNYGFVPWAFEKSNVKVPYDTWSVGMPSRYSSTTFIYANIGSQTWQDWTNNQKKNSNMWWWSDDTLTSNWNWSKIDRQWPCPDWYYVPSAYDQQTLKNIRQNSTTTSDSHTQFASDLLIPLAWQLKISDWSLWDSGIWYLWTSSPKDTNNAYRVNIKLDQFDTIGKQIWNGLGRASWNPVRCFKNNFKPEWVDSRLTIHPNWWERAIITLVENEIITLWSPTRSDWKQFLWRYTTENFLRGTKVSTWDSLAWVSDIYARYEWDEESFIITFVNEDGAELQKLEIGSGTMPIYSWETPTKTWDVQYTYEHSGWDPEIGVVDWDKTYIATFTSTVNKYKVSFVNEDWSILQPETEYNYWTASWDIVLPAIPTKAEDNDFTYTFAGWQPALSNVIWDVVYKATFTSQSKPKYWSSWWIWRKSETGIENVDNSSNNWSENDNPKSENYIDTEVMDAYKWAFEHSITTMDNIEKSNPDGYLIRWHMAKMVVNFMLNVLKREMPADIPHECLVWNDDEILWESQEIKDYATKSCALWIMWIDMENNEFLPNKVVNRAEFWTIVSRILWWDKYNVVHSQEKPYYVDHLEMLKQNWFMTKIDNPELNNELRKRVWVVLKRIAS